MKNISKSLEILFFFLLITIPRPISSQEINNEISEEIILEIPPVKITRYEYEKNLNEYINNYKNTNEKQPSDEEIKLWQKDFIDRMYLLTELYNRGYDKRQDVINAVNSMERIILTQDHGLVYNEFITKKIDVSEEEMEKEYKYYGKHIKVERLIFPDWPSYISVLGANVQIKTKEDFSIALNKCKNVPKVIYDTSEIVWPFTGFDNIAEAIYGLAKDDIMPTTQMSDGIHLYHAVDINYSEKEPYEKIKPLIRMVLEEQERKLLHNAFYNKIYSTVNPFVNEGVCSGFMKKYNIDLFKEFDESKRSKCLQEQFKNILKDTILTYSIKSSISYLTVEIFLNRYSAGVMLTIFSNTGDLINYLYKYAAEEYMLTLADSLGLQKSVKYQLDKKNYMNKTILGFYEARELMPRITVSDEEIENYHKNNQREFLSGETAEISVYKFDTEENANIGKMKLMNNPEGNQSGGVVETQIKGLKVEEKNILINRNSNAYPIDILSSIFKLKDGQYSEPIKLQNDFIIIQKYKEMGFRTKQIEKGKEDIIQNIKKQKCDIEKNEKIINAKNKYKARMNKIVITK
ncbi:MAG: peptidyl-prolyl cis-trans isomerase [Bacteroidetes bacterium]|nr:peptidyl-prolyl cis-trans isomerase [Bacteroidota bacterium]